MNFKNLIFMATLGCSSYIVAQNNVNINGTTGNISLNTPGSSAGPSPLSIYGGNNFSSLGWRHGLTMYNHATIAFANTGQTGVQSTFFMGAPSGTPIGDFYFGTVPGINGGSTNGPVVYAFKVYGQNPVPGILGLPGSREKASTHFYTNTYIKPSDGSVPYFGVNTLEPKRVVDIVSKRPQLRITAVENNNPNLGVYTDFNAQNFGLNIRPINSNFNERRRTVFIHRGGSTIQATRLVVNGNARFRYIPQGNADCLILGRHNQGGANDNTLRRLEFTGNTNDVLQGDGTWGPKQFPCWDTNQNGVNDPNEDVNGDGVFNGLDCGTDDQIITNFAINGNTLTLSIENGNTVNVDLSQFLDNTDDQNLTSAVLDPNTNILTISIENGSPVSVDLSGIVGTTNITADNGLTLSNNNVQWGQVNTNGTSLNGGQLIHHTEIPMNNYNVLFSGLGGQLTNTFSIGGVNTGRAKLNVYSNSKNYGMYINMIDNNANANIPLHGSNIVINSDNLSAFGSKILVDVTNYNGNGWNYGQYTELKGGTTFNIGQQIYTSSQQLSQQNIGSRVSVYGKSNSSIGSTYSVTGGVGNTGVYVQTVDTLANINYGINVLTRGALTHNIAVSGVITDGKAGSGTVQNYGIRGQVQMKENRLTADNAGGIFYISQQYSNSNIIKGVKAGAFNGDINSINYGVHSVSAGLGRLYGGYFSAEGQGTTNVIYGIYAKTYGTGTNGTWAGYFQGNLHATGQISSTNGTIIASDQQFKTNVNNLTNSLDIINQLQPKTFYYDTTTYADFDFETDQQMGLIAQDVEQVLPTLVTNLTRPEQFDTLGNSIAPQIDYKGVEYGELIPLLIGGIQEQQAIITTQDSTINVQDSLITDLNNRLTTLENCLSNLLPLLCQINNNMIQQNDAETQKQLNNMLNIELSDDTDNIVLNQNVPNPFAEQTTITYTIPATVQKAQIHFYDQSGKLIRTVEISERGNGRINVFASDLSTGIYTYTLVADGQIIASKRMVKTN